MVPFFQALPRRFVLSFLGIVLLSSQAWGHPHVFLDGELRVRAAKGRVTALELIWEFDEAFSRGMAGDFDRNGDGKFDQKETKALFKGGFENLKHFGYFLRLELDGKVLPPLKKARDFSPRLDGETGKLVYRFVLPVDLAPRAEGSTLVVALYDTSYYVDTLWKEGHPGKATGDGSLSMAFSLGKGKAPSEYWGTCEVPQIRVRLGAKR